MRDMDNDRNRLEEKYEELDNDLKEMLDKEMDIDLIEKDDVTKGLWKEMDEETRDTFRRLDREEQKEILDGIKSGRMSLAEARQIMNRKL